MVWHAEAIPDMIPRKVTCLAMDGHEKIATRCADAPPKRGRLNEAIQQRLVYGHGSRHLLGPLHENAHAIVQHAVDFRKSGHGSGQRAEGDLATLGLLHLGYADHAAAVGAAGCLLLVRGQVPCLRPLRWMPVLSSCPSPA